jgi:hypothetical protein
MIVRERIEILKFPFSSKYIYIVLKKHPYPVQTDVFMYTNVWTVRGFKLATSSAACDYSFHYTNSLVDENELVITAASMFNMLTEVKQQRLICLGETLISTAFAPTGPDDVRDG